MNFFYAEGLSRTAISLFFILKIFAGLALWTLYTYYYPDRATADIFKYFDDSKIMYDALFEKPDDFQKFIKQIVK